ncbi:MAG: cbb3-type cytochrome c oxidase N-terminal domain-containing protein [Flammeovirgaceae bacterium]|nr:cbb3-type cytochrome c oxidase N-terminal domain-containing protein [Flammeovirgaceae bacterium]
MKKLIGFLGIFLVPTWMLAQDTSGKEPDFLMIGIITLTALLTFFVLIMVVVSLDVVMLLRKELYKDNPEVAKTFWEWIGSLKPLAAEKKLLLDEEYDGIQELDNPVPAWFNVLFYGTIAFGAFYLLIYHVWNVADLQDKEYEVEVAQATILKEEYMKKAMNAINETNVTLLTDATSLQNGEKIFQSNCASCHGKEGEGRVGPNLTDRFWLHGNKIGDVFKVVKNGVQNTGMIPWGDKLNPKQIQEVSSFVLSLKGKNPANPKAPEGIEMD